MKNEFKPNFFIVGAPKCGTTSIYSFLKQHPDIYMPDFKEPHFFGSDLNKRSGVFIENENDYLKLFQNSKNARLIGEASTHYLYSEKAHTEIYKFNPNSKIIIALRNPSDLIYSLHSQYLYSGNENVPNFKFALELEKQRVLGENNPPYIDLKEKVLYKSYIKKLPKQIELYKEIFKDNLYILLLDDLINDINQTYKSLAKFLNVDYSFQPNFKIKNPNKISRNYLIRDSIKKYGVTLGNIRKFFFKDSIGIMKSIEKLNRKVVVREPMEPELRDKLIEEFLPIVNSLEKILDRNLSNWKKSR